MDKVERYEELIRAYILSFVELSRRSPIPGIETLPVFDERNQHYLLVNVGWQNGRRQRATTLFARIHDGKIWIEEDWTEEGLANALTKAGVPKSDIVLAFQPPDMRPLTEFAVA